MVADVRMGLIGRHQRDNAVTAAGAALALRQQGYTNISVVSILAGLSRARLPGRFQVSKHTVAAAHTAVIGMCQKRDLWQATTTQTPEGVLGCAGPPWSACAAGGAPQHPGRRQVLAGAGRRAHR